MIEVEERPLLTFALFAYNQEKYIREAVEGALAQTYQPLEVVLSDDCSSDSTFEIMKTMANSYRGRHRVRLNRNKENLGIAGHVNHVMALTEGELVIAAAGDDISMSHRVERIFEAWRANPTVHFFYSDYMIIESCLEQPSGYVDHPECQTAESMTVNGGARFPGCTEVWHQSLFSLFGPISPEVYGEDRAIAFRAALVGGLHFVSEPLVKYRRHRGSISARYELRPTMETMAIRQRKALKSRYRIALLRSFLRDLNTAVEHSIISKERAARLVAAAQLRLRTEQVMIDSLVGSYWGRLLATFRLLFWPKPYFRVGFKHRAKNLFYALIPAVEAWRDSRAFPGGR